MNISALRCALLDWFRQHKRDLPWRTEPRDPYRVWLSEVMLQQTQVATVIPYFERWLSRFPTIESLAAASPDEVLKLWEGLGYYARARNLHRAAQLVVHEHNGRLPDSVEGLLALPGVGRYTAGAIASLAYNKRTPALDGNTRRVICRLFAHQTDETAWTLAESLLPEENPGNFNEALIELGALVCTPRAPRCDECPLKPFCAACATGAPEAYPQPRRRTAQPQHCVLTAVIVTGSAVLLAQRPTDGLLGGLWEFVSSELRHPPNESLAEMVQRRLGMDISGAEVHPLSEVRHAFTHFRVVRQPWLVYLAEAVPATRSEGYATCAWITFESVDSLALTRSDQRIWAQVRQRVLWSGL